MNFSPFGNHFPIQYTTSNIVNNNSSSTAVSTQNQQYMYQTQHQSQSDNIPSISDKSRSNNNNISISTAYVQTPSTPSITTTSLPVEDISILLQSSTDAKRVLQNVNTSSWAQLSTTKVADYLSHLPTSSLPLSLHHFLKYSAENIKKEQNPLTTIDIQTQQSLGGLNLNTLIPSSISSNLVNQSHLNQTIQTQTNPVPQSVCLINPPSTGNQIVVVKKKKKKKTSKERKPRPKAGEIRIKTALDGSSLFVCPECQMAYPEKEILELHMLGHNLERKYVCEICEASLKRKDHLTRHRQSHIPDRPFSCAICFKSFKRKEQLSLHEVIHTGQKRHICQESSCGKSFYRKDHLRKHTRSHIARRVKAELSLQQQTNQSGAVVGQPSETNVQLIQQVQLHQISQQIHSQNQHVHQTNQQQSIVS